MIYVWRHGMEAGYGGNKKKGYLMDGRAFEEVKGLLT